MLLTAQELLAGGGVPSREQIREHLSGNYCRCTGYHAIVDAVEAVAQARQRAGNAMKIAEDSPPILTALDRPNSYIGRSVPRPNLARLTQGRAQYRQRRDAAAHGACGLRALAARARAHRRDRDGARRRRRRA